MSSQNKQKIAIEKNILSLLGVSKTFEKGFRLLVQTYQERLYWHIRSMVKLHDDTDEVLQNTFIKAYKGFPKFRGASQLYTWLYRIATNESITFIKKKNKQQTVALDATTFQGSQQLQADIYFDSETIENILKAALETLPTKQKEVFMLRYYQELPYKKISEQLGTSVGGLKASYHHAIKKIELFVKNKSL